MKKIKIINYTILTLISLRIIMCSIYSLQPSNSPNYTTYKFVCLQNSLICNTQQLNTFHILYLNLQKCLLILSQH